MRKCKCGSKFINKDIRVKKKMMKKKIRIYKLS